MRLKYFYWKIEARFYKFVNGFGIATGDFFMFMSGISVKIVTWSKNKMQKMVDDLNK